MSCSRVLLPGERVPAIVYGLARALVMVLLARACRDGVVFAPMHVGCEALRLALPVGARMAYRPVLQRLARGWPAGVSDVVSAYSVQAVPAFDACPSVPELGFCDGPDPEGVISHLLDAVQERFGASALDLGRVLRRWWMGRKIAFEAVPPAG